MNFKQWALKFKEPLIRQEKGRLSGLKFSVKELIAVEGYPTSAGTFAPIEQINEGPVVSKLLAEGAELIGKTHTHEIAFGLTGWNPVFGHALNPLDPTRMPGGSSSGAAISVATDECDFAIGTDTGGSIRAPASLCGLIGYKPTYNRYSLEGVIPLSPTCDHVGIIAKDINVITRVDEVLAEESNSTLTFKPRPLLWNVSDWVEPEVWNEMQKWLSHRANILGTSEIFQFDLPPSVYRTILIFEAAEVHRNSLKATPEKFGKPTLELLQEGARTSKEDYQKALQQRLEWKNKLDEILSDGRIIVAPTVPSVAQKIEAEKIKLSHEEVLIAVAIRRLTSPWSLLGVPVVSLTIGFKNLSLGIQLIGRQGSDRALLSLAEAVISTAPGGQFAG